MLFHLDADEVFLPRPKPHERIFIVTLEDLLVAEYRIGATVNWAKIIGRAPNWQGE